MANPGYRWSIRHVGDVWTWALTDHDTGQLLVEGEAATRALAAAMVVRAIARGTVANSVATQRLAA